MAIDKTLAEDVLRRSECLYDAAAIEAAIIDMAARMNRDLAGQDPLLLCVMNGGLVPTGRLLPHLDGPLRVDYLHATRYRDTTQGHGLEWQRTPQRSLRGETVVIIDDILDEGYTLEAVMAHCREAGARAVHTAVLTRKQHDRGVDLQADWVGLEVPDRYVFGAGMDYRGYWRNAAGIYAAPEEV